MSGEVNHVLQTDRSRNLWHTANAEGSRMPSRDRLQQQTPTEHNTKSTNCKQCHIITKVTTEWHSNHTGLLVYSTTHEIYY